METAAMLIIGDEILAGSTHEKNLPVAAKFLADKGIRLSEVRIIPDDTPTIISVLNHLRVTYTYVITSGGIGPTHDDLTTAAIAQAFGVGLERQPEIEAKFWAKHGPSMKPEVLKMADYPAGAVLFPNLVSTAPGYQLGNVFVMAGIPAIFQAMLQAAAGQFKQGHPIQQFALHVVAREGQIAAALAAVQQAHPTVSVGSYPTVTPERTTVKLVARSADPVALAAAAQAIAQLVQDLGLTVLES